MVSLLDNGFKATILKLLKELKEDMEKERKTMHKCINIMEMSIKKFKTQKEIKKKF